MHRSFIALAAATALAAPAPALAQTPQIFRCDQQGAAFYYRIGPGEFSNWVGAGNGYPAKWLDSECKMHGTTCVWINGVLGMSSDAFHSSFDTNTGLYRYGPRRADPGTTVQCTRTAQPQ
jgi:hypothetical protein